MTTDEKPSRWFSRITEMLTDPIRGIGNFAIEQPINRFLTPGFDLPSIPSPAPINSVSKSVTGFSIDQLENLDGNVDIKIPYSQVVDEFNSIGRDVPDILKSQVSTTWGDSVSYTHLTLPTKA